MKTQPQPSLYSAIDEAIGYYRLETSTDLVVDIEGDPVRTLVVVDDAEPLLNEPDILDLTTHGLITISKRIAQTYPSAIARLKEHGIGQPDGLWLPEMMLRSRDQEVRLGYTIQALVGTTKITIASPWALPNGGQPEPRLLFGQGPRIRVSHVQT